MTVLTTRKTAGIQAIQITTGGTNYGYPPVVNINQATTASGTGATAIAIVANSQVSSVVVVNPGYGYTSGATISFSAVTGGTGAGATASIHTGSVRPMSFFRDRRDNLYGVDGMGRGIAISPDATTSWQIGLAPPAIPPALTLGATTAVGVVEAVQIIRQGNGYSSAPDIAFTGGTPTRPAAARATLQNGRVVGIVITDRGAGYQSVPSVSFSGGMASSAAFTVNVIGRVQDVEITGAGSGYTSNGTTSPTLVFNGTNGLTSANAAVSVDENGRISSISVLAAGTGATATGITASITGGGGTGAAVKVNMAWRVSAVSVANSGAGFHVAPFITISPLPEDTTASPASVTASVNGSGNISGVTVLSGGQFLLPPTAEVKDTTATGQASMTRPIKGTYQCAIRFTDNTTEAEGGTLSSNITEFVEVDAPAGGGEISWALPTTAPDSRTTHIELWRTTADQSVILFRVARLALGTATYVDTLSDEDLQDVERSDYALMPVTLPSGQINARRFGIPPGQFAVGCMFQDRAWYAVDASGAKANSLYFSEIDEPESVPPENEILLQENVSEKDSIVALIPFSSALLIVQRNHLYKLTYVAQPVIDASFILGAYRGVLNNRCWATMNGVAFLVDTRGMYAYDGQSEEAVSVAVDNYWRDKIIDFTKSDKFHVCADPVAMTVRFYYCQSGDTEPTRALCYCIATKAWWEETYPVGVTATCRAMLAGRYEPLLGTSSGNWKKHSGVSDDGYGGIAYELRTGPLTLANEQDGDRSLGVLYKPTSATADLALRLHYNNSVTPRTNAIASNRGSGFTTITGSTEAILNMSLSRSALGDATGHARAYFSGRVDDKSAGGDKHVAVALAGTQSTTTGAIGIYGLTVSGAS